MALHRIALSASLRLVAAVVALTSYPAARAGAQESGRPAAWAPVTKESIARDMPSDVRALVEKTFSTDRRQRMDAARELGWLGARGVPAIPFLIRLLNDYEGYEDANPSREASMALVRLGPSAVEPLIAAMRARGNRAKEELAVVLGLTGDRRAVPALIDALEGDERWVGDRAAWALGLIRDPRAVEPLLRHVGDHNPYVAYRAIEALGRTEDRRAIEPLIAVLKNRGAAADLRASAASSLGEIGDPLPFEPLLAIFKDKSGDTILVVDVLGMFC